MAALRAPEPPASHLSPSVPEPVEGSGSPQIVRIGTGLSVPRDNLDAQRDNGGVFVSMDVVTMLASAATILVALFGGFAWMIRRMDAGFAGMSRRMDTEFAGHEARADSRFDRVDARFDRVDARLDRLEDRVGRVEQELTEVKISIARLEGPTPRLVTSR